MVKLLKNIYYKNTAIFNTKVINIVMDGKKGILYENYYRRKWWKGKANVDVKGRWNRD